MQYRVEQRKGQHSGNVVQLGSGAVGQHGALRTFHILRRPHHSFLFRRSTPIIEFFHPRSVGQLQSSMRNENDLWLRSRKAANSGSGGGGNGGGAAIAGTKGAATCRPPCLIAGTHSVHVRASCSHCLLPKVCARVSYEPAQTPANLSGELASILTPPANACVPSRSRRTARSEKVDSRVWSRARSRPNSRASRRCMP